MSGKRALSKVNPTPDQETMTRPGSAVGGSGTQLPHSPRRREGSQLNGGLGLADPPPSTPTPGLVPLLLMSATLGLVKERLPSPDWLDELRGPKERFLAPIFFKRFYNSRTKKTGLVCFLLTSKKNKGQDTWGAGGLILWFQLASIETVFPRIEDSTSDWTASAGGNVVEFLSSFKLPLTRHTSQGGQNRHRSLVRIAVP